MALGGWFELHFEFCLLMFTHLSGFEFHTDLFGWCRLSDGLSLGVCVHLDCSLLCALGAGVFLSIEVPID